MAEDYPVNVVFRALDRVSQPIQRINDRIDRLTGPMRRFNNRMRAMGRTAGLQRVSDAARNVGSRLGNVADAAGRVATRMSIMTGVAAFGLQRMFSSFGRTAEQARVLSQEMGVGLQWLQEWQFAAERAGVPQDRLNESMREFNGRLGELRTEGAGPLAETLKEMNPQLMRQLEQTNSLEQAWGIYMDALEKTTNEQNRAALAGAAFSDEGRVLANVAALGSERVAELRREAQRYGQVMGEDAVDAGTRFLNVQRNMRDALAGLSVVVSTALLPVVNDLFTNLTAWIVDNQDRVRDWAQNFAANLPGHLAAIQEGVTSLFDAMQPLVATAQWLFDTFGTGETILVAVGAVIGGPLIAALAALVPAVVALGTAIGFTPIGWFLGGMAAIAAGIYGLKAALDWIESRFPAAFQVAQDAFGVLVDALLFPIDAIMGDFDGMMQKVERMGATFDKYFPNAKETWNTFVAAVKSPFDWLFEKFDTFMEKIRGIGDTIDQYLPDWFSDWLSGDSNAELNVNTNTNGGADITRGAQPGQLGGASGAVQAQSGGRRGRDSKVQIDLRNLPPWAEVTQEGENDDIDLSMGLPMRGG